MNASSHCFPALFYHDVIIAVTHFVPDHRGSRPRRRGKPPVRLFTALRSFFSREIEQRPNISRYGQMRCGHGILAERGRTTRPFDQRLLEAGDGRRRIDGQSL
ncbi:MAG: hypothetical protein KDA37_13715 [Planctomycetales bacterium]|nr:hypothetical protein [Planctomycetales bacterium]